MGLNSGQLLFAFTKQTQIGAEHVKESEENTLRSIAEQKPLTRLLSRRDIR